MEAFIEAGWVKASPLIYEDFLPVSAAGIFQSNLSDQQHDNDQPRAGHHGNASRDVFEAALGRPIIDELSLYAKREAHSAQAVIEALTEGR